MPLKAVVGGAEKLAAKADIYISGAKKRVVRIEAWNGSAWKLGQMFAPPMTLTVTSAVSGTGNSSAAINITTGVAVATPNGGIGPYSYSWSKVSGSTVTVNAPANASTTFTAKVLPGDVVNALYRCTATDSLGQTASGNVSITITNISGA